MNYEYVFKPIECIHCKESHNVNSDYQIGQEFKCPRCCESHILQHEDVKEIWFYITIGSIDELHRIKIDHEKQKGILERMVAPVSSNKVHRKELVIEKYEEIKRELENNPIWGGYSWEEYPPNEDIPTSE